MKLIHPGLQLVIMGSGLCSVMRWMSSCASSMIVKSAVNWVSKTRSKPRRLSAATIWPVTKAPSPRPIASPSPTLMAGAVCTRTVREGSLRAAKTSASWLFSTMAPVGQTRAH